MGQHVAGGVDKLPGGEQQRVALARALVVRPRCLLLDEPLSNLDAKLRHSMRDEIRRICKEQGLTAIYVTHDQKEALVVADRIAVMKRGRVLQVGTPEEIYRRPTSRTVASFIGETNLFEATVRHTDADVFRVETRMGELAAARPQGFAPRPRDEVWVSVRPECFALGRAGGADATNVLAGAIEATFYTGAFAEHRIRCGAELLRAYELNPRRGAWAVGTAANLAGSPDAVILLPFERADA